ncbi:TPA: hypothetical protein HA238_06235 [Candidatus Micrarchaeota archaeon]|nr:hypothetical protein [Candidatus Micrarchaeota archaeon]
MKSDMPRRNERAKPRKGQTFPSGREALSEASFRNDQTTAPAKANRHRKTRELKKIAHEPMRKYEMMIAKSSKNTLTNGRSSPI